ncbi:MAG: urease accessory protein UreD [Chloroflexi bacterium]|nr:urease accessory protein UreD [Chloroflexota bacterium]
MVEVIVSESLARAGESTGTEGRLDLSVVADGGIAVIQRLYQQAPLRALFPHPEFGEPLTAVLVNSSGGVVGGDRLTVEVEACDRAEILVTGQAAEKVYRSAGRDATVTTTLSARLGAFVEFLPQGTIVYDGARLRRVTTIDIAPTARVMAGDALSLGRVARGERFTSGLLHDEWRVRVDGRLVWADALHLSDVGGAGISASLDSPAGFAGNSGYATFVYAAADASRRLESARRLLGDAPPAVRAGATSFEGLLVARWLGPDMEVVRSALGRFWASFRVEVGGRPQRTPTIWNI